MTRAMRLTRTPHLRDLDEDTRSATPLELFFDLVFTAALGEITRVFVEEPSMGHLFESVLLFLPIVWTWATVTVYGNRFDTDDAVHRVMKVLTMVGVALMGISAAEAFGARSTLFVAGFLLARGVLLAMYMRAIRQVDSEPRAMVRDYLIGYGLGAVAWAASFMAPPSSRPFVGALIILLELLLPVVAWSRLPSRTVNVSHLSERFGLFTILVLGGGWLAIVGGVSRAGLSGATLAAAGGLLLAAVVVWWTYFDYAEAEMLELPHRRVLYVHVHLLMFTGLGLAGAAAEVIVEDSTAVDVTFATRLAFCGGVAAFALGLAALRGMAGTGTMPAAFIRLAAAVGLAAIAVAGEGLSPPVISIVVAMVLLVVMAAEAVDRAPSRPQRVAASPELE